MDFVEAYHVVGALVVANTADAAAAVVPEDEDAVVGGEIVPAETQEVRKAASRPHIRVGRRAEVVHAFRVIEEAGRAAVGDAADLPAVRAAGLDHDLDIRR